MSLVPDLISPGPRGEFSIEDLALRHKEFIALPWEGRSTADVAERFFECYGSLPMVIFNATCD